MKQHRKNTNLAAARAAMMAQAPAQGMAADLLTPVDPFEMAFLSPSQQRKTQDVTGSSQNPQTLTETDLNARGFDLVASSNRWQLWAADREPWASIYVKDLAPDGRKVTWWLSHDGKRFAGSRDLKRMQQDEPEALDWIQDRLAVALPPDRKDGWRNKAQRNRDAWLRRPGKAVKVFGLWTVLSGEFLDA